MSLHRSKGLPGLQRWCDLGLPFIAAALAAFGMQHLLGAQSLVEIVPPWMPWRLLWVYFVGLALFAAALSFSLGRRLRLSAPLLALLFFLLAALADLPGAMAAPRQWIRWSMMLRELSYAAGALAIVSFACLPTAHRWGSRTFAVARWIITGTVTYFAIEQLNFPQYSPGVPDLLLTPAWVPGPHLLTHLTGIILMVSATLLLVRRYVLYGAALTGTWMVVLTLAVYTPMMFMKFGTTQAIEGVDFVFDTLLFAGTALSLARGAVSTHAVATQEAGSGMHQNAES